MKPRVARLLPGATLFLALCLVSCAAEENKPMRCGEILAAQCVHCHDGARFCDRLGRKTRERWEETVDRMIRRGAALNMAQKSILIDCLNQAGDEAHAFCR